MRPLTLCLALSLLPSVTSPPVVAQTEASPPSLGWVNIGVGAITRTGHGPRGSALLGLEGAIQKRIHLLSLRGLFFDDLLEKGGGSGFSILYGRFRQGDHYHAAFSIGPSLLLCKGSDVCSGEKKKGAGLAVSGQAFLTAFQALGLGLHGFGDLNSAETLYGVMISLRFGRLGSSPRFLIQRD